MDKRLIILFVICILLSIVLVDVYRDKFIINSETSIEVLNENGAI